MLLMVYFAASHEIDYPESIVLISITFTVAALAFALRLLNGRALEPFGPDWCATTTAQNPLYVVSFYGTYEVSKRDPRGVARGLLEKLQLLENTFGYRHKPTAV